MFGSRDITLRNILWIRYKNRDISFSHKTVGRGGTSVSGLTRGSNAEAKRVQAQAPVLGAAAAGVSSELERRQQVREAIVWSSSFYVLKPSAEQGRSRPLQPNTKQTVPYFEIGLGRFHPTLTLNQTYTLLSFFCGRQRPKGWRSVVGSQWLVPPPTRPRHARRFLPVWLAPRRSNLLFVVDSILTSPLKS